MKMFRGLEATSYTIAPSVDDDDGGEQKEMGPPEGMVMPVSLRVERQLAIPESVPVMQPDETVAAWKHESEGAKSTEDSSKLTKTFAGN